MTKEKKLEIQMLAENVLANLADDVPCDVAELVKKLGLEAFVTELEPNVSGQIDYKNKIIKVAKGDIYERQRFSVAHEIGHYLLHNDGTEHVSYRSDMRDDKEAEANYFAANLLMPEYSVRYAKSLQMTFSEMAMFFIVSPAAMGARLSALRLENGQI